MVEKKITAVFAVFLCIIAVFFLFVCLGIGYNRWKDRTCFVKCPDSTEEFVVQNNKNEPEWVRIEVARRLGVIVKKVDKLVLYMYNNNLPNVETSKRLAERWKHIRTNPSGFRETAPGEASAAYTVNKGEQMRICIRDERSDNMFEDENDSMFVIIHELAHLMSKSYGHNLEFKKNFSYITKVAVDTGEYKYIDYSKKPTTYCSVDITHTAF